MPQRTVSSTQATVTVNTANTDATENTATADTDTVTDNTATPKMRNVLKNADKINNSRRYGV